MSSSNGATLLGGARGYEFDIDGIDFPRPTYAPAVWLCIGEPGEAAALALNRWLTPPSQPGSTTVRLVEEPDEPRPSDSLALLRRITRVIPPGTFPASESPGGPVFTRLKIDLEEIMSASELRGGWRDDIIVPHLWIVCDLALNLGDLFFSWLDATLEALRKEDIVCRTTVVARYARVNRGEASPTDIKLMMRRLAERVMDVRSNLSTSFRLLVLSDRDRRGSLFTPQELANAIGHFAEFVLLAKAPGAVSNSIVPLFRSRDTHHRVIDPWEHLPIFGSLWLTRIQIKGSDARLRINPELRTGMSKALTEPPTKFWVPETPVFDHIDLVRDRFWPTVDLPTWRTFNWEEAPEETQRFAIELDRWLNAATYWRRATLASYVEFGEDIRRQAIRSVERYWRDLDHLGALVLNDPEQTGGIEILDRLVARAIIEIEAELAAFPKLAPRDEPENRRESPIGNADVQKLVPEPTEPLGNALETLARRIVRRVHPPQLILLTIICAFMIWHWTVISIRHWDESGFGWIGRKNLPFKIRDPILLALSHRAQQLRDWLAPTPIGDISMLHWVLISLVLGAIAFDLLVLLIDRWGVHRAVRKLRKRTQAWIDDAHHELPALLAHRETVTNKIELEKIGADLRLCQKRLAAIRDIAVDHGVVPLAPDTVFSTNVRLASPAFAPITSADIQSVTMGIRHALAANWRRLTDRDFVQIVLDQEEPVTARGGRAVHDPRAELKPLVDMIESRMPNSAHIMVPPMFSDPVDRPGTSFSRIVSLPAHSSELIHDALIAEGYDDLIVIAHEPERIAFVVGLELDVPASTIFGSPPKTSAHNDQAAQADKFGERPAANGSSGTAGNGATQNDDRRQPTANASTAPLEDVSAALGSQSDSRAEPGEAVLAASPVDDATPAGLPDDLPVGFTPAADVDIQSSEPDSVSPAFDDPLVDVSEFSTDDDEADAISSVDPLSPPVEDDATEVDSVPVSEEMAPHDEADAAPDVASEPLPVTEAAAPEAAFAPPIPEEPEGSDGPDIPAEAEPLLPDEAPASPGADPSGNSEPAAQSAGQTDEADTP